MKKIKTIAIIFSASLFLASCGATQTVTSDNTTINRDSIILSHHSHEKKDLGTAD